ncbi:MAG TPA: PIN domain-containing protein [Candidatus Cybelea sp.]|jgi:predicted nucleic acid-binding protein|nr:PIN domain-containing protein [Candidatus Cybelea sp.]
MTHLLDISTLLAAIWQTHSAHDKVDAWLEGKSIAVCPLSELGFLRISTQLKGPFRAPMRDARELLSDFTNKTRCSFIAADLPGLKSEAKNSDTVTDCYLAELAARHGMKLATLDTRIPHKAVEVIG